MKEVSEMSPDREKPGSDASGEQDETMNCGLGIAERNRLHRRLRNLPDTVPPRVVWQRIEAQARAEGLLKRSGRRPFGWLYGAGLAAASLLAALLIPFHGTEDEVFPTVPPYSEQVRHVNLTTLNALMVQSRELEQDLRALPEQPQLVRAGTAATIAGLEDQIAAIDFRLNQESPAMTPEQTELYWRERVRLMNLLVQLRAAQAQRNTF
ncbi:MAG: hypothetical protein WD448_12270 [Woeseia sp.]